jgi:hypothetical protein
LTLGKCASLGGQEEGIFFRSAESINVSSSDTGCGSRARRRLGSAEINSLATPMPGMETEREGSGMEGARTQQSNKRMERERRLSMMEEELPSGAG